MGTGRRLAKAWGWIRLVCAALLFAWALMVVLPAPRLPLFYLTLGATEYGHWLAPAALGIILAGSRRAWPARVAGWLARIAMLLFISSAVRASFLARELPTEFTRAFADLGYRVPDDAMPAFQWRELFAGTTFPAVPVETLAYPTTDGSKLPLDFYRCPIRPLAPCVIALHGGGWNGGSRTEFPNVNRFLIANGYAVAAIDYRLAPGSPWPAQRDDVLAALAFLRAHAAELGIDPTQFVLLGRSAGGQIAEAVAFTADDPAIRGCVAFYAPADLRFAFEFADPKDILNSYQLLLDYLGGSPAEVGPNYDSATANFHVTAQSVPTLLLHGRRDSLVWHRQSERLAARLREAGTPYFFLDLPWATHAFDYNLNGPGGQLGRWTLKHFLDAVTHREPVADR